MSQGKDEPAKRPAGDAGGGWNGKKWINRGVGHGECVEPVEPLKSNHIPEDFYVTARSHSPFLYVGFGTELGAFSIKDYLPKRNLETRSAAFSGGYWWVEQDERTCTVRRISSKKAEGLGKQMKRNLLG